MTRRARVAFFTPLAPMRSGIADYSEELLPELSSTFDIDVIVDQHRPPHADALGTARIRSLREYAAAATGYDVQVYQVGNNVQHHGYMLPVARRVPGVLVLHDYCLHYLILGTTLGRGDLAGLQRALAVQYGDRARRLARQLMLNAIEPLTLSFSGELIRASQMIIVHSEYARRRVLSDHPDAIVRVVPMGVRPSPPPSADRLSGLRQRLGLDPHDIVVASVSTPAHNKRLDLLVRAFCDALRAVPDLKLLVLGAGLLQRELRSELAQAPAGRVVHTGWLSGPDYRDAIGLADVVVDLRYPAAAETSASLLRALLAGKPAVVAEHGPFSELPDACCVRISRGVREQAAISGALVRLTADPQRRAAMGAAAQAYARQHCDTARSAAGYARCLDEAIRMGPSSPVTWSAAEGGRRRPLVAGMYNASRIGRIWRTYGTSAALRRIREEVRRVR